jgi:phage-related protein
MFVEHQPLNAEACETDREGDYTGALLDRSNETHYPSPDQCSKLLQSSSVYANGC